MPKRILIIAPHPDDEVLGCGGIIKKFSNQDKEVMILIMSRGKSTLYSEDRILNIRNEALMAHKILGVHETRFMDYPAPELDLISISELSSSILSVIDEFKPGTIFLPHSGDLHHDHKAVFNAGLVAARPIKNCPVKCIYSYETLSETDWSAPFCSDTFIPNCFINITEVFPYKTEAMSCYKSQLRAFPNPRSLQSVEALSNLRGGTVGFSNAEAFMAIRIIKD